MALESPIILSDPLASYFKAWREARHTALIPYITAGYPNPQATAGLLRALADAGADIIELGVPFSDPVADGPTIQRSSQVALDHGITLEEYTPFGVVGAITPSTHSIPTLSGNIVNICAAGNSVVFNAHPSAAKCAALAVRAYNEAIYRETGIENIACIIEKPTIDSFNALCKNEHTRLLLVTGGPMVVKAAMQTGKRAICAGPGNPPVFVDDTCCPTRARRRRPARPASG